MANDNNSTSPETTTNSTHSQATPKPPPVLWAQRADQILLTIDIEDCKAPKIDLQSDKLLFKGKSDSIQSDADHNELAVTIEFYKPVKVEESRHVVKARGIEFIIHKQEESWWPRLLKTTTKQHWLKIDFPKWKDEDDSDDEAAGMGGFGGAGGQPDFGDFMQQFGAMGGGGAGMPGADGLGDDGEFDDESDDDETEQLPDLVDVSKADGGQEKKE